MNFEEQAISFACNNQSLYGIVSRPRQPLSRGVIIVVGGPQYRVGSHRQFVLLARHLAASDIPVMRFDYRGMGDSSGDIRNFEDIESDIGHAIDEFFAREPSLKEVVIWGLCDAASAALFYAHGDPRVRGLVLLNPWVRTDGGMAKAYLKHYYLSRLTDRELWSKIFGGRFDYVGAAKSICNLASKAMHGNKDNDVNTVSGPQAASTIGHREALPERMREGFERFKGEVLLIMSGNDITAKEFSDLVKGSRKWKRLLKSSRIQQRELPEANHTFSRRDWRDQVSGWTSEWMKSW
jgi:exosortase A-associated hydrolase 1